jgi:orotidine-5'-phosphate decarboxylase
MGREKTYSEFLCSSALSSKSILCFGLDPVLEKIPESVAGDITERITGYFSQIIDATLIPPNPSISALKPNIAYFAQYGFEGLLALEQLMGKYRGKLPIILDAKRGDIGSSSDAYAREAFGVWDADAVTVSPYMGKDSLQPFLNYCQSPENRGVYVLCRTSNQGAKDFQSLYTEDGKNRVFLEVADKIAKWGSDGTGAVVGATDTEELEKICWILYDSGKKLPLLIPGVGAQGGSASEVAKVLRTVSAADLPLHRINSSSAISYAYQKAQTDDFVHAALDEIGKLNREIGKIA